MLPPKNSSSVAFYKKYRGISEWRNEKKFLELGLENAPKIYSHNIDDPSITMEFIPGVRPDCLCEKWFEVFKKHVKELNEVADTIGWIGVDNGPNFHIEECENRLIQSRSVLGSTKEVENLGWRMRLECHKIENMKWNNDNTIIGSLDYGPHNTIFYNDEYRLIDFEYVSHVELSIFAVKFWIRTRKHHLNMFGSSDDSKLIEELSQYQVNDAWIEQYRRLKYVCLLQLEMKDLIKNR